MLSAAPGTALHDHLASLRPAELVREVLRPRTLPAAPDLPRPTQASLQNARRILANTFDLVGESYALPEGFSWRENPSTDKEWQIAQHKFYFAVDLVLAYRHSRDPAYLRKWVALLDSWLTEMGTGFITASDAQVEARRVEHWVYSLLLLRGTTCEDLLPAGFVRRLLERIAEETWYITQHLKPVRNHRTFQLWTVFLVGVLFPEFRRHAYFLQTGRDLLVANLLDDFLPDGVHVELSTHYHQLALEVGLAFLDLARRNAIDLPVVLTERVARAARFSMWVQWPDGSLPLLNDSDDGDQRPLLERAGRLFSDPALTWAATLGAAGHPPRACATRFDTAGYFVLSNGWGTDAASFARRQHVVYDCARLGEGSHSHYDLFNFIYFCDGQPAIVDPGRYTYSPLPDAAGVDWRHAFKSTAAHNTVTIDGRDQTRYISKLAPRVPGAAKHGPAVQIESCDFRLGERTDWVLATARSAEYTPRHKRLFVYVRRSYLLIVDHILNDDGAAHESVLRFHLPPACLHQTALSVRAQDVAASSPRVQIHTARVPGLSADIEAGWVSTIYGMKTRAPVVRLAQTSAEPLVFCSAVAPAGLAIEGCRAVDLGGQPGWLFRVDGDEFTDWLLFQPGPQLATLAVEGMRFRGRFVLWSRSATGRLEHVVGGQVEDLDFGPYRPGAPGRYVEWSA